MMVDFKFEALYSEVFTKSLLNRVSKKVNRKFVLVGDTQGRSKHTESGQAWKWVWFFQEVDVVMQGSGYG